MAVATDAGVFCFLLDASRVQLAQEEAQKWAGHEASRAKCNVPHMLPDLTGVTSVFQQPQSPFSTSCGALVG